MIIKTTTKFDVGQHLYIIDENEDVYKWTVKNINVDNTVCEHENENSVLIEYYVERKVKIGLLRTEELGEIVGENNENVFSTLEEAKASLSILEEARKLVTKKEDPYIDFKRMMELRSSIFNN